LGLINQAIQIGIKKMFVKIFLLIADCFYLKITTRNNAPFRKFQTPPNAVDLLLSCEGL